MSICVYLVEDDPSFARLLLDLIESTPTLSLVGHSASLADAMSRLPMAGVDLYLMDIGLPDGSGVDVMAHVHRLQPQARIMALTSLGDEKHILSSLEAGASGYVLKSEAPRDLLQHIMTLMNVGGVLSGQASKVLIGELTQRRSTPVRSLLSRAAAELTLRREAPVSAAPMSGDEESRPLLTPKEQVVLAGIQHGLQAKSIAHELGISIFTVNQHLRSIYRKLHVRNKMEAILVARNQGVL
ncbi:MAG: hypothetical protein RIQ97_1335 [Pseudomonadota bacterium]|jgi:DNA-binding NarL/FixJ family response regulator